MTDIGIDVEEAEVKLTRAERRGVFRRATRDLKPWRSSILFAAIVIVAATLARLVGPKLIEWGIDDGIAQGSAGIGVVNTAALLWLTAVIAGYFLTRWTIWLVSAVGERYLRELRVRVFTHIQGLDIDFFNHERSGRLVSRMTSDVESLQLFVSQGLIVLVGSLLTFFLTIVILFYMSWQLTLLTLALLPPLAIASVIFRRYANPAYMTVRERIANVLTRLQENLSGIRVVQAYGREHTDAEVFSGVNESHFDAQMRAARISAVYFPVVELIGLAGGAVVLAYGASLANKGVIGFGVVAAFIFYLSNLFDPIQQVTQLYNDLQAAAAALHKLYKLLDVEADITEKPDAVDLVVDRGELRLADVSFGYEPERAVLRDVSISVSPGTRLAVVGETGAGKSTLVKLMARFYDPDEGSVTVDGIDLRDVTIASLRRAVGFVPQEGHLFSGTVWENVAFGREGAGREDVLAGCSRLGVLDALESLPDGIDTEVEERGGHLSAGQRQLVALCRAYLADPQIVILDEATSALDPATAAAIEDALPRLMSGRTSITIAHRLATAERADQIVLMADGAPVEIGSHAELIALGREYARLHASWTSTGTNPGAEVQLPG